MRKDWAIFAFFLLLVVFLRIPSFFQSVITGPDESNYLLAARSMLEGHIPYVAVWNTKPPGIYILFALGQILLGESVLSIRIIACIAVSFTCYLLYRMGTVIDDNGNRFGLFAAIIYAVYSLNNNGLGSNTEIFFTPFVTFGFYLLLSGRNNIPKFARTYSLKLFLIGLAMGTALQIKYVVIFDFIAIVLIVGIKAYLSERKDIRSFFAKILKSYTLLCIGPALFFLFVITYFILKGHLHTYTYATIIAGTKYIASKGPPLINYFLHVIRKQIIHNYLLWLSLLLAPIYLVLHRGAGTEKKRNITFLLIWLVMSFLGVCSTNRFYKHYFLALLPAMCLISSYIIITTARIFSNLGRIKTRFIFILLCTPLLINAYPHLSDAGRFFYYRHIKGIYGWGDRPAVISKYLKERVSEGDYIYVVDCQPVIYYLTQTKVPTRYAAPPFLTYEYYSEIIGTDQVKELESIIRKKPVYIIRRRPTENPFYATRFYNTLNNYLQKYYTFEIAINGAELYRLKGPGEQIS